MFELGNAERHIIFQLDHGAIFQLGNAKVQVNKLEIPYCIAVVPKRGGIPPQGGILPFQGRNFKTSILR